MSDYLETYRATVQPGQCDHLGHLNVQHYVAAVNDGAVVLMGHIGLSPEQIARRGIAFAAVHMEIDFTREVRAGDEIVLESAIAKVGKRSLTVLHRLRHAASGEQAMDAVVTAVLMDLESRASTDIPDDIRAAALGLSGRLA